MDFSSIIHFLTDKTRNLSSKALFVVFIMLLLIFLDNTFSFSYYYNTSQKIVQIKGINEILEDTTLSETEKNKLLEFKSEIFEHKTFKDIIYDYLTNLNFEITESKSIETIKSNSEKKRNTTIHLLTSAWWILIPLCILLVVLPFVLLIERKDTLETILGFVLICGFGYVISLLLSKALSFIPLMNNEPIYNYVLNFIVSGILLIFIIIIGKNKNEKTNADNN